MMIFWDLETTGLNTVGQILNYAFFAVDDYWNVKSKITGKIRISCLELPHAGAILANRVNVIEHQAEANQTEREAMWKIYSWLKGHVDRSREPVFLIGYNSQKFDKKWLATSMYRNGINPWIPQVVHLDMMFLVRELFMTRPDFAEMFIHPETKKISLRLENVTQALGLLTGAQSHESAADVLLTKKLAQALSEDWKLDVRTFNPYGGIPFEGRRGYLVKRGIPQYELSEEHKKFSIAKIIKRNLHIRTFPYAYIKNNNKNAQWVSLEDYPQKGEDAVYNYRRDGGRGYFHIARIIGYNAQAEKAVEALKDVPYFRENIQSNLDIEAFIYQLSTGELNVLSGAMMEKDKSLLAGLDNRNAEILYNRSLVRDLKTYPDKKLKGIFNRYVAYRYGGKMIIDAQRPDKKYDEEAGAPEDDTRHPTYYIMLDDVKRKLKEATSPEDIELLSALKEFYLGSKIARLFENLSCQT